MKSIEDILRDTAPTSHKIQEPKKNNAVNRVISGGNVNKKDNGHRTWNQTIQHNMELRNELRSSIFKTVSGSVTLEPSKLGAYSLKINGNTSINLSNPYRIPENQESTRTRFWKISCRFFYGTNATLTWPSNVRVGANGVYPGQPGTGGTSDVFTLMYDERSGEWFVMGDAVLGSVTDDPEVANHNAVIDEDGPGDRVREDEVDTGDSVDSGTSGYPSDDQPSSPATVTDYTYDRPVETPGGAIGNIFALHADGISFSPNAGASWVYRSLQNYGTLIDIVGIETGRVWILNSDGEVYTAKTFNSSFVKIDFEDIFEEEEQYIPVINPDFESGNIDGWTVELGQAPNVLNSLFPAQKEDSEHYLSKNWRSSDNESFSISQEINEADPHDNVKISVDAYASVGGIARLRVEANFSGVNSSDIASNNQAGNRTFVNGRITNFATSPDGDTLDLVLISGNGNGLITRKTAGVVQGSKSNGNRVFEIRYANDDSPYFGLWSIGVGDYDNFENLILRNYESVLEDVIVGSDVTTNFQGNDIQFDASGRSRVVSFLFNQPTVTIYFGFLGNTGEFELSRNSFGNYNSYGPSILQSVETTLTDEWENISVNIPDYEGTGIKIYLESDVFTDTGDLLFDNVVCSAVKSSNVSSVNAMAWTQKGADMYLGDNIVTGTNLNKEFENTGFENVLSASTNGLFKMAYNGSELRVKSVDTQEWELKELVADVVSLSAGPINVALSQSGELYEFDKLSGEKINQQTIFNNDYLIASDYRRNGALFTGEKDGTIKFLNYEVENNYATFSSEDWPQQPVIQLANENDPNPNFRRSVCLDGGRVIGWNFNTKDIYYTDRPNNSWKLAGALYKNIIKIVEIK